MSLTVRELTEIPYLRTHIHAGASGADRVISWAHSSETENPWEWLEKGDLLMTVGLGIPAEAAAQVNYVESLAAVEVSGVAIGADMQAPPLSDAMLEAAERRSLPIMFTAFEVPFIQISRTVAGASQGPEHLRLVKTVRVYDSLRAAVVRSSSPAKLLQTLGDEIGCSLSVCSNERATEIVPGAPGLGDSICDAFRAETRRRGPGAMPGIVRLNVGDCTALVVPVPARRPASLIAVPKGSDAPPYVVLQHVATVAALEYERLIAAREELRRLGSETLAGLLDARLSPLSAAPRLKAHGLDEGPMVVMMATPAGSRSGSLHHDLGERDVAHMVLRRDDMLYCLTPAEEGVVEEVATIMADGGSRVGISDAFTDLAMLATGLREARWALEVATTEVRRVSRYGEPLDTVGPRSLAEARLTVERVLGPVLAYDRERGTELVPSLAAFLRANRSWKQAADELHVHKQTLGYRMRRVEELTGRKLCDTGTLAELWFAVSALDLVS